MAVDLSALTKATILSQFTSPEALVNGKVTTAINFFVGFSALVAVIMIIVAGYTFITAAGDPDKIDKAGKTITAAVVGLVIVFIARILVEFVIKKITG